MIILRIQMGLARKRLVEGVRSISLSSLCFDDAREIESGREKKLSEDLS